MTITTSLRKLLVVDDEPQVRQMLDFCLRDDYEVTAVASGKEALAAVRREPFPVVILDLFLEGLSGVETLKGLKEIQETQNVIILTAFQTMESAVSALNLGAFCYLTKPFEHARLKEAVEKGFDAFDHQVLREREMKQRLLHVHDAFFSLLCHEFNTPMNVILGFSDLMASSVTDPEHRAWVEEIRKSGTHLHEILMEIVDYTAASHSASSGNDSTFCPKELLESLVAFFLAKNIRMQVSEGSSPCRLISGPSESVMLIARKLVSMASLHNSPCVFVDTWVNALDRRDEAVLNIEVTGDGLSVSRFDPESLAGLFEPYGASGSNSAGQRLTLGIELATSRKIAEYAGGTVDVFQSENGKIGLLAQIPVRLRPQPQDLR